MKSKDAGKLVKQQNKIHVRILQRVLIPSDFNDRI